MSAQKVLVVGSTGLVGMEICRLLSESNFSCRALVRASSDPDKVKALEALGAELAQGDLKDPSSLDAACQGVFAVISTASSTLSRSEGDSIQTVDHDGQVNLVKSAASSGVQKFVFVSFPQPDSMEFPLAQAKDAVEKALAASGMDWTSLRANWFMEVWLSPALGFDYPNGKATVYGSGDQTLSWISYSNVAQFAVESVLNAAAQNRIIPIGGPRPISPNEVVAIFERIHGKTFEVTHVPVEALQGQFDNAGNPLEQSFAALMLMYAEGAPMEMEDVVSDLPVELKSVEQYATQVK